MRLYECMLSYWTVVVLAPSAIEAKVLAQAAWDAEDEYVAPGTEWDIQESGERVCVVGWT